MSENVKQIELSKINANPENPRITLDEDVVNDIQNNITINGFHESRHLTIKLNGEGYLIIDGHHRFEAAKRAGFETVPCWVREDVTQENEAIIIDEENNQNPLSGLERGINIYNHTVKEKGGRGKKGNSVNEYCKRINKSHQYGSMLYKGAEVYNYIKDSEKLASQLASFKDKVLHLSNIYFLPKECWELACELLIENDWSAKDVEKSVKKTKDGITDKQIIALFSGKISVQKLKQIQGIKDTLLNWLEDNRAEDNTDLVQELREDWEHYFETEDPLDLDNVRDKREQIENSLQTGNKLKYIDFRQGDFEKVYSDIPDGSIDCIITDPPYPHEFIEEWTKLAKFAKRVLKKNGFCIAYSGQTHLPEVINRMHEYLDYYWMFNLQQSGNNQLIDSRNLFCGWKPILVFQNGFSMIKNSMDDVVKGAGREKDNHPWQQAKKELDSIIENFTNKGEIVIDPFAGGGTTIMACAEMERYIKAAEIDEEIYENTQELISDTPYE